MKTIIQTLVVFIMFSGSAAAQETFLDGFPDVPLIEGFSEVAEERIVFDTPAGTVAQTELISQHEGKQALALYADDLPAFGWRCENTNTNLRCNRDGNRLIFTLINDSAKKGRIILRLEPVQQPDVPVQ